MARSVIPLDILVSDVASDMGDSVGKYKPKIMRHAVNGYRNLNMFLNGQTEVKSVILSYSNAINLPCDFQYISKVGVRRPEQPCIAILTMVNDTPRMDLNDTATCDYLNSVWAGQYGGPTYPFYNVWGWGYYFGELYGMGRTIYNRGTYSIDKAEGILYVGGNLPPDSEIIIEYVGNGIEQGLTVVPMEMKECLEFYIRWKFYMDKNPNLAQINESWYKKEYNKLKRYYNHRTPNQMAIAVNQAISPTNY